MPCLRYMVLEMLPKDLSYRGICPIGYVNNISQFNEKRISLYYIIIIFFINNLNLKLTVIFLQNFTILQSVDSSVLTN